LRPLGKQGIVASADDSRPIALKEAEFPAKRVTPAKNVQKEFRRLCSRSVRTYKRLLMRLVFARPSLAIVLLAMSLAVAPAGAETILARYSVSLVGFRIGEASAKGAVSAAAYRVVLDAHLTGLADWLAHMRIALASSGEIHRGNVLPNAYATTAATARDTRTVRMALQGGNVRAVDISPPLEDEAIRIPVPSADKRNVLDPTSALIMTVPAGEPLVGPSACNRTLPIYDGVVRFDLTMSYTGTRNVSVKGYSGPVSVCAVRYKPIAGHRYDSRSTKFMAENHDIEVWLAPVERAHVVIPFHIALRTMAGMAYVDAIELNIEDTGRTAKFDR
jgi:hypothetical protein